MSAPRTSGEALSVRGVVKSFRDGERVTEVLRGVDLDVEHGEIVALMGRSGSGKSTLLSIIGTLLRPNAGSVRVGGREVTGLDDREVTRFRNLHLGFVFQFHHLLPDFTARENVLFPAYADGVGERPEAQARAETLLDRVGLAARIDYRAAQLSGGEKQRVAVARALMNRPIVVLADEPTGNLDRKSADDVLALIVEMSRAEGTAFLVSTHDAQVAARCDRVLHLGDGRIGTDGPEIRA